MTYSSRRMKLLSTSFEILADNDADESEKKNLFVSQLFINNKIREKSLCNPYQKLDTLYANFRVYPPASRCIPPVNMWHTRIHVLMVQISS